MKAKVLCLVLLVVLLAACGSDNDNEPIINNEKAKYLVTMEVEGKDFLAEFHVYNLDNVNLYDEIKKKDTQQSTITQGFTGKISYSTLNPVKAFIAQGILVADSTSTLKMAVFKDGKNVYEQSLTVEKKSESNHLVFISVPQ